MQTANTLLMIEPVAFGFNAQTAENNYFQQQANEPAQTVQANALREFKQMTAILQDKGVEILIVPDTLKPYTPDSIFPNNWISFHADGTLVLYPMFAENRRLERRPDIFKIIENEGFIIRKTIDYSHFEKDGIFLEGTGSMVLDRVTQTAYAALSERTHRRLFLQFCKDLHFTPCCFSANQSVGTQRLPVYHTNVMMSVGDKYAVVCLQSIDNETERKTVVQSLQTSEKEIVEITEAQMHRFAGNMLQIENRKGDKFLILSETAYQSLTEQQIEKLSAYNEIVPIAIPVIEKIGGGSVRCMMAEIFLQKI
jgi:hypothetical protein